MGFFENGGDRYDIFLSYASADNDRHNQWVSDFERYLKKTIAAEFARRDEAYRDSTSQLAICRDETGFPEGGDLQRTIDERVRQSQFLIIFLGSGYLNSPWCLSEFDIFRESVGGTVDAALKRLYLIVLDREALERLREGDKPERLPEKRATLWKRLQQVTASAIRMEDFVTADGELLPVYRSVDRADPDFHRLCSPLVQELAKKLIEVRQHWKRESVAAPPIGSALETVAIGAVPSRLAAAGFELAEALHRKGVPVDTIGIEDLHPKHKDRLRERLKGARLLVQPFDRSAVEVVRGSEAGGHLAYIKASFDSARGEMSKEPGSRLLWWEPPLRGAGDAPPLDEYDQPFIDMIDSLPVEWRRSCPATQLADELVSHPPATARVWIEWAESDAETVEKAKNIVRSRFEHHCRVEERRSRRIDATLKFGEADWTILQRQLKGKPDGVVIVYNENKDPAALEEQEQTISNMEEVLLKKMFPGMFYMRTTGMFKPTDDWSVVRFTPRGAELVYRPDELDGFVSRLFDVLYEKYRRA